MAPAGRRSAPRSPPTRRNARPGQNRSGGRGATLAHNPTAARALPVVLAIAAVALGGLAAGWARPGTQPPTPWVDANPPTDAARREIPAPMLSLYRRAATRECPGLAWNVLAGIGRVETDHHRNRATSSAGARGPMQFMPATWDAFGVDGDGDGVVSITDPADAVPAAARYLCASGGDERTELRQAIWDYNHADWYVELVLEAAARYGKLSTIPPRR